MSLSLPSEGRTTLAHGYRNLSEREIRARLDQPMSEAERATAKAELMRRNADDDAPDTTLATGFELTSAFDLGAPDGVVAALAGDASVPHARAWPWVLALVAASAAALGWVIHARLAGP